MTINVTSITVSLDVRGHINSTSSSVYRENSYFENRLNSKKSIKQDAKVPLKGKPMGRPNL